MSAQSLDDVCIPAYRAVGDQAELWFKLKEHVKAELGKHAAAGLKPFCLHFPFVHAICLFSSFKSNAHSVILLHARHCQAQKCSAVGMFARCGV